jgi:hypothetical protein
MGKGVNAGNSSTCYIKDTVLGLRDMAALLGLTVRQYRYYARWAAGVRQVEIAREFGTTPSRVCEVIRRARQRNPHLPMHKPRRRGREVQLFHEG